MEDKVEVTCCDRSGFPSMAGYKTGQCMEIAWRALRRQRTGNDASVAVTLVDKSFTRYRSNGNNLFGICPSKI